MNRRAFCLALLASACGGSERPKRAQKRRPKAVAPARTSHPYINALPFYEYQKRLSPFAFHGDVLVVAGKTGLQVWDSLAMTRGREYPISHGSFCFLQDGSLVAIGVRGYNPGAVIHRIDSKGTLRSYDGPGGLIRTRLLPAASPAETYCLDESHVSVIAQVGERVETVKYLKVTHVWEALRHSYSLGDGRLVIIGSDLTVLHRDGSSRVQPMRGRDPRHVAPATRERCWYTLDDQRGLPIHSLVLARIDEPALDERRVRFDGSHIVDLASSGSAAAVLLMTLDKAAASHDQAFSYAVVVVGDDGAIRWRVELAREDTLANGDPLRLNTQGAIAMSDRRVVLRGLDGALLAWDVATGQRIGG